MDDNLFLPEGRKKKGAWAASAPVVNVSYYHSITTDSESAQICVPDYLCHAYIDCILQEGTVSKYYKF